jgi:predicted metal-dependent enzyme (double-stranded beta helix superfamily)
MRAMTFAEVAREILRDCSRAPERATPGLIASRVGREAERYLGHVRFSTERYMRHPVLLFDDWEVMLIAWESGQVTPIHDHRGVMGGMFMLSGVLQEERFTTPGDTPSLADERLRPEGDLCEIGPTVLHRLMPRSARAVSLHIYRPPLRTMGIWDATGMTEVRASEFDVDEAVLARAAALATP